MTKDALHQPSALDAFHRHEVPHMASVVADMFESYIEQHHYTRSEPELTQAADDIADRLRDFYQLVGRKLP